MAAKSRRLVDTVTRSGQAKAWAMGVRISGADN